MTTTKGPEASHLHPVQVRFSRPTTSIAATSVEHAVEVLAGAEPGTTRIIAGASDLLLDIERGARRGITTLVDVSRIPGADDIRVDGDVARLGPLVTHADVIASPALVQRALPLAQACLEVGSPQLRNRATIVGNVVTASPANDTISPLLALDASIRLRSARGERTMPIERFITGFRTTELADDELVTGIDVPLLAEGERGVYVKLGNRSAQAISVVHLAVVVGLEEDERTVRRVRLAIGSVAPTVVVVPGLDDVLVGRILDADAARDAADAVVAHVRPIADVRATAEYRASTVAVVVRRALRALAEDRHAERWPSASPLLSQRQQPPAPDPRPICVDDEIHTTVNGRSVGAAGATRVTLLDWLREEVGLTGTKEGCAEGECGACTIVLDGDAVMACLVPAARADGATITTVEGIAAADGTLHPLQDAFVELGAVQCGYCTPGFIVAGVALLDEHPAPTGEQVRTGFSGNLCRCTGYGAIIQAVERAAFGASR